MSISNNLYNQKWQKFLGRIWPFKFIPFVDFVLAAGSLATGNMRKESDFDVIVGVRQGRIFTARFFCWLIFGMLGWRAKHPNLINSLPLQYYVVLKWRHSSKDKICFNHFVAPKAYRLSPPYNEYWENLYQSLISVYGEPVTIQKFFDANVDWLKERRIYKGDQRHIYRKKGLAARIQEWILGGWLGDQLEKLKFIQIYFIERSFKNAGHKPRIIYNDNELEFHPHTQRIEEYVARLKNRNF